MLGMVKLNANLLIIKELKQDLDGSVAISYPKI